MASGKSRISYSLEPPTVKSNFSARWDAAVWKMLVMKGEAISKVAGASQ